MARDFNGTSSDYTQASGRVSTATDNITMCAWVQSANTASGMVMVNGHDGGGGGSGYGILVGSTGHVRGAVAYVAWVDSNINLTADTWGHVLFTRKSGTWKTYADGDGTSSATSTSNPSSPSDNYTIGMAPDSGGSYNQRPYDGIISEVAFWERALDDAEITSLSKGFSPLFFPESLVSYVPMIGKASPEQDIVSGDSQTITGTTATAHPPIIYPQSPSYRMEVPSAGTIVQDIMGAGFIPFAR